jgi:segregation and condensation protein A
VSAACLPQEPFDGPLDLLLDEVRRQKIAIEEVALAPLVARYLDYMEAAAAQQRPLDIDWILLAATLIHWKSRSLLLPPAGAPTAVAADPVREEIVSLLLAHRQQAAEDLNQRLSEEAGRLSRGGDPAFQEEAESEEELDPPFVSVSDLTQQARDLARWASQYSRERRLWRQSFPPEEEVITVAEMTGYLRAQFTAGVAELDATRLLAEQPSPLRRVSLFLAVLDMARNQQLRILQTEAFADILLAPQCPFPSD